MNKTTITTYSEFESWCGKNWQDAMSLDFETTTADYYTMQLVGFSLYNGKESCYMSIIHLDSFVFAEFFQSKCNGNQTFILHKAPFDMACLKKFFGVVDRYKVICTLTGAKLLDEDRGKGQYALKVLAYDWLKISPTEIKSWKEASQFGYSSPEFYDYAMNDSIWTWDLWQLEKKELKKQELTYLFNEIEMPFQLVLRDLETNGVLVDRPKLDKFKKEISEKLIRTEAEILDIFELKHYTQPGLFDNDIEYISPVNFNSTPQIVVLIEKLGFVVDNYTDKGNPSVDKYYRAKMRGKHKFFDLLDKHSELSTLYDTFISPCDGFIDEDGKIRPSYHLIRSGRLSCSEPNLTNLPNPKRKKMEVNYREIFVPEKGHVFVKADFSGQELRNLAEVSKDRRMINAFNNNFDLHLVTANYIFNLGLEEEKLCETSRYYENTKNNYSSERYKAKNGVNFPIVYGTTATGISKRLGVTRKEAQRWIDGFFKLYPDVKKSIEETRKLLYSQGYATTLMGRRRRFPFFKNATKAEKGYNLRSAFNHRIQGFSADQAKLSAIKTMSILERYNAYIVLWIHDELVYSVFEDKAKEFSVEIKDIMEGCLSMSVPAKVDISIVSSFGE